MGLRKVEKLARAYRKHAFNLIPVGADKKPLIPSWRNWAERRQRPDDMAAMPWAKATGVAAIGGSVSGNLFCIDLDRVTDDALLARLLDALGLPTDYPWAVVTPGGGGHVWLTCEAADQILFGKGKIIGRLDGCDHVELRGRGHYTILPGSRHPNGGTYRFAYGEPETVPADPPARVGAELLSQVAAWHRDEEKSPPQTASVATIDHPYVKAAIQGEVAALTAASEGERNDRLNASAFALGSLPLALADITSSLLPVALRLGLTERESLRTIESGYRAGQKAPREIPKDDTSPISNEGKTKIEPRPPRRAVVLALNTIEPEEITWLWPGRVARGKLTLFAGDPGLGKSFLTLDMAARISKGGPWPHGGAAPLGNVLLLTAEDGLADTVVPRLVRMGADRSHLHVLKSVLDPRDDQERLFQLRTDIDALEDAIAQCHPVLVIVDPLSAYLAGIDSHKTAEVRGALAPLMTLGDRTGVALLCTAHLSKAETRAAIYRVTGSLDFVAAARAAFLVAEDPNDAGRGLVLALKMNIAEKPPGIAFRISDGVVVWENEPVTARLADLLLPNRQSRSKLDAAKLFLAEVLADGPLEESEIGERAKREDISPRTLQRAKAALTVVSEKQGLLGGWVWSLPGPRREKAEDGQASLQARKAIFDDFQDGNVDDLHSAPTLAHLEDGDLRDQRSLFPLCGQKRHRRFWRLDGGNWRCAVCHPPTAPREVQWCDLDNPEPNGASRPSTDEGHSVVG